MWGLPLAGIGAAVAIPLAEAAKALPLGVGFMATAGMMLVGWAVSELLGK